MQAKTGRHLRRKLIVGAVAAACAGGALAFEFETDSGWRGSLNTTITASESWRAQNPDKALMSAQNSLASGKFTPSGATSYSGLTLGTTAAGVAVQLNLGAAGQGPLAGQQANIVNILTSGDGIGGNLGLAELPGHVAGFTVTDVSVMYALRNAGLPLTTTVAPTNYFRAVAAGGIMGNVASGTADAVANLALVPNINAALAASPYTNSQVYQARAAGYRGGALTDAANQNYKRGDAYSRQLKVFSELTMSKGDMGGVLRVKGWYDDALKNDNRHWGNQGNGYAANEPLSDHSASALNRFDGLELMDAYVYTGFDIGETPAQIRVGRQAVNWGESLYFQGVNQLTPVDVASLRKAGTEIKEALLPVWSVVGSVGLPGGASLDAFYQLKWEPSNIDSCGTDWAPGEGNVGAHGGACSMASAVANDNRWSYNTGIALWGVARKDNTPSDSGQWGLALRFPVEAIDTELGVYAENIHARVPVIGTWGGADLRAALVAATGGAVADKLTAAALGTPMSMFQNAGTFLAGALGVPALAGLNGLDQANAWWEYPENIHVYGISAATTLAGVSWGAELSYTDKLPVQLNGNDALGALLLGAGPLASRYATGTASPLTTTPIAGYIKAYDLKSKTQFQLNGIAVLPTDVVNFFGATSGNLVGEAAFQWANVEGKGVRYGRGFIFGQGYHSSLNNGTTITDEASYCNLWRTAASGNANPTGCKNDGYMTDFTWGYRLRASLDYSNVFATSWSLSPILFWAHDVEGVSVDNQMNEGRQVLSLGLRANLNKVHNVEFNYTTYSDRAKYDTGRDKDNYSVVYSYTF